MTSSRYKVTYTLNFPCVVIDPRQTLDSVLAWSMVDLYRQKKREEIEDYDYLIENLPLKKVSYRDTFFYLASTPIMNVRNVSTRRYCKAVSSMRYERYLSSKDMETLLKEQVLDQSRTVYKMCNFSLNESYVERISYVAEITDYDMFRILVENVRYISKKKSLGYGLVRDIDITPAKDEIIRPVPVDAGYSYNYPVFSATIKPPYWKGRRYLCGIARL